MIVFSGLVFDNIVSGTTTTWYTPARFDDPLGLGDELSVHAITTGVGGTGPTLTCQVETSANGKDWYSPHGLTPEINGLGIANDTVLEGSVSIFDIVLQKFVRVRIVLGGNGPVCRLKLYATGRSYV